MILPIAADVAGAASDWTDAIANLGTVAAFVVGAVIAYLKFIGSSEWERSEAGTRARGRRLSAYWSVRCNPSVSASLSTVSSNHLGAPPESSSVTGVDVLSITATIHNPGVHELLLDQPDPATGEPDSQWVDVVCLDSPMLVDAATHGGSVAWEGGPVVKGSVFRKPNIGGRRRSGDERDHRWVRSGESVSSDLLVVIPPQPGPMLAYWVRLNITARGRKDRQRRTWRADTLVVKDDRHRSTALPEEASWQASASQTSRTRSSRRRTTRRADS